MHVRRFSLFALLALFSFSVQAGTTVENIRIWAEGGKTRVVLDLSRPSQHSIFTLRNPDRLVVDLEQGRLAPSLASDLPAAAGSVKSVRTGIKADGKLRVMFVNGGFFIFEKLGDGELGRWLQERKLPWFGGTVATLDQASMAKAYPYLAAGDKVEGGGGGGGKGKGGNPFGFEMPKMPWDQ